MSPRYLVTLLPCYHDYHQVPVLLDTNVTCPEGVNEVVTEDDVTWQLAKVRVLAHTLRRRDPDRSPFNAHFIYLFIYFLSLNKG